MSGITLGVAPGQRLKIVAITPGSPAAAAHLAPGDLLLRMEDKPLAAANLGSVATALRGTPGVTVHLDIERNGRPQRVVLRLKRML